MGIPGESYKITSSLTLYALWKTEYSVTLDTNGGAVFNSTYTESRTELGYKLKHSFFFNTDETYQDRIGNSETGRVGVVLFPRDDIHKPIINSNGLNLVAIKSQHARLTNVYLGGSMTFAVWVKVSIV